MKHLLIAAAAFASLSVPALAQDANYQEGSASHDYGYASYGGGGSYARGSSYYATRRYVEYGGDEGYSRGYDRPAYGYGRGHRYRHSGRYAYRPYAYERGYDRWRYRRHGCGCSGYDDDAPD